MPGWKPSDVRDLVSARADGGGVWECNGTVIALGTGRVLAHLHGVEEVLPDTRFRKLPKKAAATEPVVHLTPAARRAPRETHAATLLTRTTLFYTATEAPHAPLRSFRFRPTTPARAVHAVVPAAGRVRVALDETQSLVVTRVRSGRDGAAARAVAAPTRTDGLLSAGWAYVGRPAAKTGVVTPAVVERYEYAVNKHGGVWSWVRVGRCPAWYGRGQCVSFLTARRVKGGWNGVDARVKAWMRAEGRGRRLCSADVVEADAEVEAEAKVEAEKKGGTGKGGVKRKRRKLFGIF